MKIRFLGVSNAESADNQLVSFLIDEILAVDAGSLTARLPFAAQKKVKAILLSHGHYDHIRDVPAFAFSNPLRTTPVLAAQETLEILSSHLIDGVIYPQYAGKTSFLKKPALKLVALEPFTPKKVVGYEVVAVPVNHPHNAAGLQITAPDGKSVFYTGDTGPGLSDVWRHISAELLIVDLTFPDRLAQTALDSGHMCPALLSRELRKFRRIKGYLPRVVAVHLTPWLRGEIAEEAARVAGRLGLRFGIAAEGEVISV